MTMISDLPHDLVEEILSRVPITSLRAVRTTSKRWNGMSKDPSFTKKHRGEAAIMKIASKVCLMSASLHGINSIKRIGELKHVKITDAYHCNGLLLLCFPKEDNNNNNTGRLVVWNPYLCQTRWIKPSITFQRLNILSNMCCLGYDRESNHKILRCFYDLGDMKHEIYDFKSNTWRVLRASLTIGCYHEGGVSLKGNIYVFANVRVIHDYDKVLLCFDFTREGFLPPLHLPFRPNHRDGVSLSTVREEKLAVLYIHTGEYKMEIWITTKTEPNAESVSWNKFLAFDMERISRLWVQSWSFFVDEDKKVAMLFHAVITKELADKTYGYIVGEDVYFKEVDLGLESRCRCVCPNYVPSSAQNQLI